MILQLANGCISCQQAGSANDEASVAVHRKRRRESQAGETLTVGGDHHCPEIPFRGICWNTSPTIRSSWMHIFF